MTDPRVDKLADILVNYSVALQPGDKVAVQG
jgi:leucyl aminopeptidase (aminopeptidase T)